MKTTVEGTRVPVGETHLRTRKEERPDPEWIRGSCPVCEEDVVANCYHVGGKGYIIVWECWAALGENPTCDYRRVL